MVFPGVVGVDIESPRTVMPCQRTIEIRQVDILVVLIGSSIWAKDRI